MKRKSILATLLAVVMLTAAFAIPASAAVVSDEDELQTPYGLLGGYVSVERGYANDPNTTEVRVGAGLVNSSLMLETIATMEIVDYYTGASIFNDDRTEYDSDSGFAMRFFASEGFPQKVTVYACGEIRHTNSYAIWPRLYGV